MSANVECSRKTAEPACPRERLGEIRQPCGQGGVAAGWPPASWCPDCADEGGDDLVADGEQGGDGARGVAGHVVAAGAARFGDEPFAAQLAQVVGALAGAVAVGVCPVIARTWAVNCATVNPAGADRQRERCGERGADQGYVHVDAADPGSGDLGGCGQLVEDVVGQEAGVDAVEHAGEPVDQTIAVSRVVIWPNLSSVLPQPSCFVLCTIASKRRARSPLVYPFSVNSPKRTLKMVRFH